jgi:subtilisin family serine protease
MSVGPYDRASYGPTDLRTYGLALLDAFSGRCYDQRMKKWIGRLIVVPLIFVSQISGFAASAMTPNDPLIGRQWYLDAIHAQDAWDLTTGSSDVIVAVIDTGVDIYHEDLKDNIWTNPKEIVGNGKDDDGNGFIDDIHGWNFVASSNDIRPWGEATDDDAFVHGTLVSSIIAGKGNNGVGIAGIAWDAKIMPLVAIAKDGTGSTTDVADALRYAVDNGADIVNLSIEGDTEDPDLSDAMAYARANGVLTVTVSGNGDEIGRDLDATPVYPACSGKNGMLGSVTVTASDEQNRKASFADYGSCVDVSAPGTAIFAARPQAGESSGYEGGYDGTSVAAPIVAGVAALLKSVHPTWGASELRNRILASAVSIDAENPASLAGKLGKGLVNAGAAVEEGRSSAATASSSPLTLEATLPGTPTRVRVSSDEEILELAPFGNDDRGGAIAAFSDLDGDGTPEIAVVRASGAGNEAVIYGRDGQERKRLILPETFKDGALVVGTADGFVIADPNSGRAWGVDRDVVVRVFYPYGPSYANGMDLLAISGAAAFSPRNGGGRLVVTDAQGTQLVSAFPFGEKPSGRWSLARGTSANGMRLILSGLSGTKMIPADAIGQIGWTDVSFAELEGMRLSLSDGHPGTLPTLRLYDAWPR